ncbi:glycosyltransferase [Microbacterium awajiense]|uniref:Glycosyltransferase n=1 Tax=Microbacterium awajiense TaxID=415214 RepID=A0ABP7AM15_9MICO
MIDRLRILHVVHTQQFAGVEQFVRRLAIAQAVAGHSVRVIGGDPEQMTAALDGAGVRHRPARGAAEVIRSIGLVADGLDVVNTHMTAADTVAIAAIALSRHAPALVATRHFAAPRGARLPAFASRAIERRLDGEIAVSRTVAQAAEVSSTVVYAGMAEQPPVDPATRERIVLMAQRLQPEKHTEMGLRAFAQSGLAADGWRLEIAGDGPQRASLEAEARQLGVAGAVRFLGFRTDVAERMRGAGILLASSPFEHFGLSVLEAMAAGLPIVATDAGGHREMLEGLDERALTPADDPAAAARRLRALADDGLGRATLGDSERARQLDRFTLDRQVTATDAAYRDAIAHRRERDAGGAR